MASKKKVPVIISFEALDKLSEPLRKLNQRIEATTAPVRKLRNQFSRFSNASGLTTVLSGARTAALATGAAVLAAGYAAKKGFDLIISPAVEANSTLSELSERTGVSLRALQEWRYAATQNGATVEELDAAVVKFSKTLASARRGQGELVSLIGQDAPFLNQLRAVKGTEKAFELFLRQVRAVPDEANRIALLTAAFGRGADELVNMAMLSDDAFSKLKAERAELGLITEDQAAGFRRFGDLQKRISDRFSFIRDAVASRVLPALEKLFVRFESFITANKAELTKFADTISIALPYVAEGLIKVGKHFYNWMILPTIKFVNLIETLYSKISALFKLVGGFGGLKTLIPGAGIAEVAKTLAQGRSQNQAATPPALPGVATVQGAAAGAQASLVVKFENAPKGVRVETKNRVNTEIDLSLGYQMGSGF